MESYKILTKWREVFLFVSILLLTFCTYSTSYSQKPIKGNLSLTCPIAPSNFNGAYDKSTSMVDLQWNAVPNAAGYEISVQEIGGSSLKTNYSVGPGMASTKFPVSSGAKALIIVIRTKCVTGELSIGEVILLRITATQGDINKTQLIQEMCALIAIVEEMLGHDEFYVVDPLNPEVKMLAAVYRQEYGCNYGSRLDQSPILANNAFPNPFNDQVTVRYQIDKEKEVSLTIFDITGKAIHQVLNKEIQSEGTHDQKIVTTDLNPGVYFYQLTVGEHTVTKRIVKTK